MVPFNPTLFSSVWYTSNHGDTLALFMLQSTFARSYGCQCGGIFCGKRDDNGLNALLPLREMDVHNAVNIVIVIDKLKLDSIS